MEADGFVEPVRPFLKIVYVVRGVQVPRLLFCARNQIVRGDKRSLHVVYQHAVFFEKIGVGVKNYKGHAEFVKRNKSEQG